MPAASKKRHETATFVFGAGASRAVSYGRSTDMLSPLDRDFFDLLQRLQPQSDCRRLGPALCSVALLGTGERRNGANANENRSDHCKDSPRSDVPCIWA